MNLWMSGLIYGSEEGRSKAEVTHLALARSQNTRNGILGFSTKIYKRKVYKKTLQKSFTKEKIS